MPVDKEFTFVAGWILKIINSYKYWTPNPYTLILNDPREIFRQYAAEKFKPLTLELEDAYERFYRTLQGAQNIMPQQENCIRWISKALRFSQWHRRGWCGIERCRWRSKRVQRVIVLNDCKK